MGVVMLKQSKENIEKHMKTHILHSVEDVPAINTLDFFTIRIRTLLYKSEKKRVFPEFPDLKIIQNFHQSTFLRRNPLFLLVSLKHPVLKNASCKNYLQLAETEPPLLQLPHTHESETEDAISIT